MGEPAARVTDKVMHPLPGVLMPGLGSMNVITGNLPSWRGLPALAAMALQAAKAVSDVVVKAAETATAAAAGTPGAPAAIVAEKVVKTAASLAMATLMNGLAGASAALTGGTVDKHICLPPPLPPHGLGMVIDGSSSVLVNGLPFCAKGDHVLETLGGLDEIMMGCPTVLVGKGGGGMFAALMNLVAELIAKALAAIKDVAAAIKDAVNFVKNLVNAVIDGLVAAAKAFGEAVIGAVVSALTALRDGIAKAIHDMRTPKVKGMSADDADAAVAKAQKDAVAAVDKRIKDLDAWDPATQESFKKWFGDKDPATRAKMRERLEKTKAKLEGFTGDNYAPDDDAYAYVYPDKDDKMYLGEGFAKAPETGRDSKAGTLVHEASHYNTVGDTDDVEHDGHTVYGTAGAAKVAVDDPAKAQKNADNFEYFVEDGM